MKNTVIGYVWGGERMTTKHRVIAEVSWPVAEDVNQSEARKRAEEYVTDHLERIMECDDLDCFGKGRRQIPACVTVSEWDVAPEYWELHYIDTNGDHHRLKESD